MSIQPMHNRVPEFQLKDRLRLSRELQGLEQIDLANELGISRATVSNYERNATKPGKLALNAWAVVCDVDVEWLKTGEPSGDAGHDGGPGVSKKAGKVSNLRMSDYMAHGSEDRNNVVSLWPRPAFDDIEWAAAA